MRDICPKTGSLFVRAFLGRVNVRVQQKSDREKLRDEYGKFKDRANKSAFRPWVCVCDCALALSGRGSA